MVGGIQSSNYLNTVSISRAHSAVQENAVLNSEPAKMIQSASVETSKPLNSQPARPVSFSESTFHTRNSPASTSSDGKDAVQSNQQERETAQQEQQVQQVISQLKARDTEVRAHEMAHLVAAGSYARGGMSFTYQTGPDGRQYAIGGEVGIDTSPITGDPEATMQKAMVVQRAALAPAEPSAQDQKVAQAAQQMMTQARVELSMQSAEARNSTENEQNDDMQSGSSLNKDDLRNDGNGIARKNEASDDLKTMVQERQQFNLRVQLPLPESLVG